MERGERTELRAGSREKRSADMGGTKDKRWKMGGEEPRQQNTEVEECRRNLTDVVKHLIIFGVTFVCRKHTGTVQGLSYTAFVSVLSTLDIL